MVKSFFTLYIRQIDEDEMKIVKLRRVMDQEIEVEDRSGEVHRFFEEEASILHDFSDLLVDFLVHICYKEDGKMGSVHVQMDALSLSQSLNESGTFLSERSLLKTIEKYSPCISYSHSSMEAGVENPHGSERQNVIAWMRRERKHVHCFYVHSDWYFDTQLLVFTTAPSPPRSLVSGYVVGVMHRKRVAFSFPALRRGTKATAPVLNEGVYMFETKSAIIVTRWVKEWAGRLPERETLVLEDGTSPCVSLERLSRARYVVASTRAFHSNRSINSNQAMRTMRSQLRREGGVDSVYLHNVYWKKVVLDLPSSVAEWFVSMVRGEVRWLLTDYPELLPFHITRSFVGMDSQLCITNCVRMRHILPRVRLNLLKFKQEEHKQEGGATTSPQEWISSDLTKQDWFVQADRKRLSTLIRDPAGQDFYEKQLDMYEEGAKDEDSCPVCLARKPDCMLHCMHMFCTECTRSFERKSHSVVGYSKKCPMCRQESFCGFLKTKPKDERMECMVAEVEKVMGDAKAKSIAVLSEEHTALIRLQKLLFERNIQCKHYEWGQEAEAGVVHTVRVVDKIPPLVEVDRAYYLHVPTFPEAYKGKIVLRRLSEVCKELTILVCESTPEEEHMKRMLDFD